MGLWWILEMMNRLSYLYPHWETRTATCSYTWLCISSWLTWSNFVAKNSVVPHCWGLQMSKQVPNYRKVWLRHVHLELDMYFQVVERGKVWIESALSLLVDYREWCLGNHIIPSSLALLHPVVLRSRHGCYFQTVEWWAATSIRFVSSTDVGMVDWWKNDSQWTPMPCKRFSLGYIQVSGKTGTRCCDMSSRLCCLLLLCMHIIQPWLLYCSDFLSNAVFVSAAYIVR